MRYVLGILVFTATMGFGQIEEDRRLDDIIDDITYAWDLESSNLRTYKGLLRICHSQSYKDSIVSLLNDIHHYDTILYDVLTKLARTTHDREVKQTLKEIKRFEEEYNTNNFIHFMHGECEASDLLEKDYEELKNGVAENSYSGQVRVLETELYKYVKNVTGRVDQIRYHVHHIQQHFAAN